MMWFPTSIIDAIIIKKAKQLSARLDCEDSLPSGGWLNCFKFLVLYFHDDTVFTCMFWKCFTEVYFFCYDI